MPETDRSKRALDRAEKDVARRRRRVPGDSFARSLALVGSVGWPVVAGAVGGALAGDLVDRACHTGELFSGLLLVLGTAVGSVGAFLALRKEEP